MLSIFYSFSASGVGASPVHRSSERSLCLELMTNRLPGEQSQPNCGDKGQTRAAEAGTPARPAHYPEYIFGLHERGGEQLMVAGGRPGWLVELAAIGLDGSSTPADYGALASAGLGVIVRINHGYGRTGTLPTPDHYPAFAAACARLVARS